MADEKTFIVPLRKEYRKAPMYRRTKKAVNALRTYIAKHMKVDEANVRIGMSINVEMWKDGIKNPPHKVKIVVSKDDKGNAVAELFGAKKAKNRFEEKSSKKTDKKAESKEDKKEESEDKAEKPKKTAKKADK